MTGVPTGQGSPIKGLPTKRELQLSSEVSFERNDRSDLESLQPTAELCAYYRTRIAAFEKEREDMLDRLQACNPQREEMHRTQWELNKRVEEVKDLQKALSDAHTYLFEERQRLLDLQAENDELKLQEMEDRKRIQHLLALTEPVEQEITYTRNEKVDTFQMLPKNRPKSAVPATTTTTTTATGVPRPVPAHMAQPVQACERVMRTVYLPTSNVEALLLKCESLQSQLNEQKRYANERIAALLEDRRIRESDEDAYRKTMERRMEETTTKLKRTEELLANTTRDYIVMRRHAQANEQVKMEKVEEARSTQRQCHNDRLELQMQHDESLASMKSDLAQQQDAALSAFRSQLKRKEEELVGLGGVHAAVMHQYQGRIKELEEELSSLKEKHKALGTRRTLDLEGFSRDVTNLRKQLAVVDRKLHQMRLLCRLEDDDRLDHLLEMLEKKAPSDDSLAKALAAGRKPASKPKAGKGRPASAVRLGSHDVRSETAALSADIDNIATAVSSLDMRVKTVPSEHNPNPA